MKTQPSATVGNAHPQDGSTGQNPEAEILRLVSVEKCKQAVELAKEHHKRMATADSQRLLVQTYVARIQQFQSKGMAQEAQTLLTLVQQRFPAEQHQLEGMEILAAAASGRMDDLLRPLASEQISPEKKALIESAIARRVTDLAALAASEALPAGHPLRIGAEAVRRAFAAVTSGPVTDADIALPEISHRSPLAAWKMAVRAIAAFYRQDDAACRRFVDAIPVDSAVAPVAMSVAGMVDGKRPATGIAAVLHDRVMVDDRPLRSALQKVDSLLGSFDLSRLMSAIRDSLRLFAASRPELLEKLRQHISVACVVNEVPVDEVVRVLGSTLKNAYFWRMFARGSYCRVPEAISALYWHRFLCHAIAQGMFSETSAEAAAVWLRIADTVSPLTLRELGRDRERAGRMDVIRTFYDKQPAEIARLRPQSDKALADLVLQPGEGFRQAAKIQPDAETFSKWWAWAQSIDLPDKLKEEIALQWQRSRSKDVQPLVILSSLAESRDAFSLALKRLGEAEAIDPLNQQVRQARVRLTLSITWRHFADRKAHLVEKDLADLALLPSMGEGDRAAVLECLRGAWHALRGDAAAEAVSYQAVVKQMGVVAAEPIFNSIKVMAKQAEIRDLVLPATADTAPLEIALAQARIVRLANDLNLRLLRPGTWSDSAIDVLRQRPCPLSNADVLILGKGGIAQSEMELAYQASAAGLERAAAPAIIAQFLLLRARSLNKPWHQPRATQCLRAALELAKQTHDEELMREVFAAVDRDSFTRRIIASSRSGQGMSSDVLQAALDNEKKAGELPRNQQDVESFLARGLEDDVDMSGPFGGFGERDDKWDDDNDDYSYDDDEDDDGYELDGGPFDTLDEPDSLTPRQRAAIGGIMDEVGMEELARNPMLMLDVLAKAMGRKLSPIEMQTLLEQISSTTGDNHAPAAHSGGQSKRRKKRRRR